MKSSIRLSAPVITFLSPNKVAATRVCEKIEQWTAFSRHKQPESRKRWGVTWELQSLACSETGTKIQYMTSTRSSTGRAGQHFLIALQDDSVDDKDMQDRLFESLSVTKSSARLLLSDLVCRPISPQALLGADLTPFVQVSNGHTSEQTKVVDTLLTDRVLKELAMPYFHGSQNFAQQFDALPRVSTGLYQLSDGLLLRPLPASQEDHKLCPPSLIFHSAKSAPKAVTDPQALVAKIGCSGINRHGQTMIRHDDTQGIDIRFCTSHKPSSMFCEAQESLLASSLEELQSTHVLNSTGKADPRTLQADCWVEFRANMARPMGFVKRTSAKIATAPNLPYE